MPLISTSSPWTATQVAFLERWQREQHPYTCARCRDELHVEGELYANTHGFICATCDYRQEWALLPVELQTPSQLYDYVHDLIERCETTPRMIHLEPAEEVVALLSEVLHRWKLRWGTD